MITFKIWHKNNLFIKPKKKTLPTLFYIGCQGTMAGKKIDKHSSFQLPKSK